MALPAMSNASAHGTPFAHAVAAAFRVMDVFALATYATESRRVSLPLDSLSRPVLEIARKRVKPLFMGWERRIVFALLG